MHGSTPTPLRHRRPTALVAVGVLLLWPRQVGRPVTTAAEAGRWPVFAIVLNEPDEPIDPAVGPLLDLIDRRGHADGIRLVNGHSHWTLLDRRHALLKLTVHATAPVRFAVDILVPARPVLGILDVLARGATIALTTPPHASKLPPGRVDIRGALAELVLLDCPPSTELATLADTLCRTEDGH